jgi:hypothetical protein
MRLQNLNLTLNNMQPIASDEQVRHWARQIGAISKEMEISKEPNTPFTCKVKFTYFKASGKFYTHGELEVMSTESWSEIMEKARMRSFGKEMPGLSSKGDDFFFMIESEDHPHAYPAMYYPTERNRHND